MGKFDAKVASDRIRRVRQQHSGDRGKSKFARLLGISPSTYSYYEKDRVPPIDILIRISEETGTDLHWLLTGSKSESGIAAGPNAVLLRKVDECLRENPELGEAILAFVELLREKKGFEKRADHAASVGRTDRPAWIPVLGRTAAGIIHFWDQTSLPKPQQAVTELDDLVKKHIGKTIVGTMDGIIRIDLQTQPLLDGVKTPQVNLIQVGGQEYEEVVEFIECENIRGLFPDCFALRIDGDSMSPRINDGDIVILSPSVSATQGHVAIARLANQIGVTCKLIRTTENKVHLIPINERYETKVVPKKELLWALAVLGHVSL